MKLLLIEDNQDLATNLVQFFEHHGFVVDYANNGQLGLQLAEEHYFDIIILDLMLPKLDGIEVCNRLRENAQRHIPIIMLTARDTLQDKLLGFSSGADDYLTKPFELEELRARCMAICQRISPNTQLSIQQLTLSPSKNTVTFNNKEVRLSSMAFKILHILMRAYPNMVSRRELTEQLWPDEPTQSDALRSHIYQLRKAFDQHCKDNIIKTYHGVGFGLHFIQPELNNNVD